MSLIADVDLDDLDWWTRPAAERDAYFASVRASGERPYFPELDLAGNVRGRGFYAVTRYADVMEVSRRPEDFCSGQGTNIFDQPLDLREFFGSIIAMDNPQHARQRRIISRGFTAKNLEALRANVGEVTREVLGTVAEKGECDFVTEVAALIPLRIVNDMMGIPRSQEQFIFESTNKLLGASDPEYVPDQSPRGVAKNLSRVGDDFAELLRELAADRLKNPGDDLISLLVAAEGDNLTAQELASFFILLVGAGNETTRNAIAHGLLALTQNPDQRALWAADIDGVTPTAVDEVVRWASPVLHMRRTVTADGVRLGDQEFREGDKLVLWYRSANQDESVFPDGTRFDVRRDLTPPHLGFGAPGPHFCLGAHLARLELAVVFKALFEYLPDIHAVEEPQFLRTNFLHGIKHLKAAYTPTTVRA
ncbi:cytochrome P450 [Frankia torreyi]|uniref:Cytochrome P450 n=1 Tax=Frankia torreyi TaxID=1856 RepID=A0A0D8BEL3_9ACTN|nr:MULTISPECIES: cytochrome P450 [Frankia]KJE21832.1 cytochrome P450 [Frankia torreyi]KQC38187.1 cytochrome [Frankia sp. ACN1ag]KQM03973.1 cytochrome P450 [Frankia sp. CpI1-P]